MTITHQPIGLFAQAQPHPAFDPKKHARRNGPGTSRRAAEKLAPNANSQCGKVLAILREGPIKNHELAKRCVEVGVMKYTARVSDLRGWGLDIRVDKNGVYRLRGAA